MARGDEQLRFTVIGEDRASDAFSRVGRSVTDLGGKMDIASRVAKGFDDVLKRQNETARRSADATLALARTDKILADAEHALADGALEADFALKKQADGYVTLGAKATKSMEEIRLKADELRAHFPEFKLKIDDAEAKRKLAVFAAESKATTELINRELSRAGGGGGGFFSKLGGLFGGSGSGGGLGLGSLGSAFSAAGPYAIGGALGLAALLAPGVIGLGIGGGVGLAGIGGSLLASSYLGKQVTAAQSQVKTDQAARLSQMSLANTIAGLQQRIGSASTASQRAAVPGLQRTLAVDQARYAQAGTQAAGLGGAQANLRQDQQLLAPFTVLTKSLQGLGNTALLTFAKSVGPLLKPVAGIFADMGRQVKLLGPDLTAMFKASLPFIDAFASVMMQAGKILIPAFTQSMQQMVKSGALPIMAQGLTIIVKGLAGFITALGPGMKSSAMIFRDTAVIIGAALRGAGLAFSWLANVAEDYFHRTRVNLDKMGPQFDDFRHRTAVVFDGVRHDIAHYWDMTWNNTVGRAERGNADVTKAVSDFNHNVAHWFDVTRHDVAAAWDTTWNNTVGRTQRGVSDVMHWIGALPGRITGVFRGAGGWLVRFGKDALNGFLSGVTSIWGHVTGWFNRTFVGFLKGLGHLLGMSPPHPGSVMWELGANLMDHLFGGIKSKYSGVTNALTGAVAGAGGAAATASGSALQVLAQRMAAARGWTGAQWNALNAVEMREAGWNMRAVNPTSGAYGIAQFINGPSEYAQYGGNANTASGQITGFLNYIAQRYGTPSRAWAHEMAFGWYGSGLDATISSPTLIGVGERGPERVTVTPVGRAHGGGAQTIIVKVDPAVAAATPDKRLAHHIAQHILTYTKTGGRLYPDGVKPR